MVRDRFVVSTATAIVSTTRTFVQLDVRYYVVDLQGTIYVYATLSNTKSVHSYSTGVT